MCDCCKCVSLTRPESCFVSNYRTSRRESTFVRSVRTYYTIVGNRHYEIISIIINENSSSIFNGTSHFINCNFLCNTQITLPLLCQHIPFTILSQHISFAPQLPIRSSIPSHVNATTEHSAIFTCDTFKHLINFCCCNVLSTHYK